MANLLGRAPVGTWLRVLGLLAAAACDRAPSTAAAPSPAGSASAAPDDGVRVDAAASARPRGGAPLAGGCHDGADAGASAPALVEDLSARCAAGLRALAISPGEVRAAPDAPAKFSIDVPDGGACVRALAVAESREARIALDLDDDDAAPPPVPPVAGRYSLLRSGASICLGAGVTRARVRASAPTAVTVRAFRAP